MWVLYDMALDYSDRGSEAHDPYEYAAGKDTLYAVGWKYAGDNNNDGKDDGYNALFRIWMSRWNSACLWTRLPQSPVPRTAVKS